MLRGILGNYKLLSKYAKLADHVLLHIVDELILVLRHIVDESILVLLQFSFNRNSSFSFNSLSIPVHFTICGPRSSIKFFNSSIAFNSSIKFFYNLLQSAFHERSRSTLNYDLPLIHHRVLLQFGNILTLMENIDGLGSTSTNSEVEDELGSTSTGCTSINDGSIMDDLTNPGGSLFDTDSDSDLEPESDNTTVEGS